MSLEQQIETLNANFAALIGILSSGEAPKAVRGKKAATTEQAAQPADSPPADKPTSPVASSVAAQQPAASTAPTVTADHITKVIIALCAKDKPAALKVLESHGVKRGGDLKPEQYGRAHRDLTDALDATVKL